MRGSAGLERDAPTTAWSRMLQPLEEVSRKMRDTAGGTPALPFKKWLVPSWPKCDEDLIRAKTRRPLQLDLAHAGETVETALRKLEAAVSECPRLEPLKGCISICLSINLQC